MTIETLNGGIVKSFAKDVYAWQIHHSLEYAYDTNTYDKKIVSICSPHIYDILTSNTCTNSPCFGFYREQGETAYGKHTTTQTY